MSRAFILLIPALFVALPAAQPYWTEREGRARFHVITYKRGTEQNASTVKLELDWEAVR